MMKLLFKVFLISLVIFGAIVFNGDKANAVSDYDDLIQLTDNLVLVDQLDPNNESKNVDLTMIWYTESLEALDIRCTENGGNWCDIYDFWVDFNFAEDHFTVTKSQYSTDTDKYLEILATNDPNANLTFETYASTRYLNFKASSGYTTIRFTLANSDNNIGATSRSIWTNNVTRAVTSDATPWSIFLSTPELVLPPGYEGEIPPETYQPPDDSNLLLPEYTYNVNNTGLLSIKYLGNLEHFLSGTNLLAIDKMTSNWGAIDENLESNTVLAGSLYEEYQLPGAGYYMITISHDQQLSIPPWSEENEIEQVLMQFYWNGNSPVAGDNIGGCDGICNPQKEAHDNKIVRAIENAQFSDGGLQGLIFAPINAIALLPTLGDSCSPITLPLMDEDVTMQCIRPMVQASPFGALYATVSVIITGLITWWVALKTFATIKGLQDPDDDKVEVLKL